MSQFRWVHIGVAALLGAAMVSAAELVQIAGAAGVGTASELVPITPCRLIDTRAGTDNVGTRATPIGSGEAASFQVTGTNGNCTIPATATGIATNATAVNPTSASYVTIYPADASPRPTASNLNFVAGAAPTPNQATTGLSAQGAIGIYNLAGNVDIIVDIVGYYQPASSSAGAPGPQGPTGATGPTGPTGAPGPTCPAAGCTEIFHAIGGYKVGTSDVNLGTGCFAGSYLLIALDVPLGAVITNVRVIYRDTDSANAATFTVIRAVNPNTSNGTTFSAGTSVNTSLSNFQALDLTPSSALPPVASGASYTLRAQTSVVTNGIYTCQAQVTYQF